ncbi:hypothetical protein Hanom_Chr09g00848861 [Helianthus anomalus]
MNNFHSIPPCILLLTILPTLLFCLSFVHITNKFSIFYFSFIIYSFCYYLIWYN